jgi:uncharacterized membrane protein YidH (DUF202 family)
VDETHQNDVHNIGNFLIAVAMLLIVAGVRFLDANELTPRANYALIPLIFGLVLGFTGLFCWIMSERTSRQSCRARR